MKNKYLTKCLCITLVSGMIFTGPSAALATTDTEVAVTADGDFVDVPGDDFISKPEVPIPTTPPEATPIPPSVTPPEVIPNPPEVTPTPPDVTPTPPEVTPTPPEVTPTPPEVTPTPPDVSPTPPDVSPTPIPDPTEAAKAVIDAINELALETITLEHKEKITEIRKAYDLLTEEEKVQVSNYLLFEEMEKTLKSLEEEQELPFEEELPFVDGTDSIITDGTNLPTMPPRVGQAVYFTNRVSNLHAGKEFYLDSLKKNYQLVFSDDFADVMDQIEKDYKKKNKLIDASDKSGSVTSSADRLLVRNWQDIIAIYIYEQNQKGEKEYKLDASCKDALAEIFAELNPVVRDKKNITVVTYGNRHINYYIKKNKIPKSQRKILKKYVETDCKLLSATVTGAKGFVRQSVGDNVSEERVNVIADAFSLVGKVGYFWGGKSTAFGEDPAWGSAAKVSAAGSNTTGTLRAYGLDCSGFVTWSVVNGYKDKGMQSEIGDGTTDQWMKANVVSEANAQPGDLVFQRGPEAGSDNHVGILCGKTDAGDWIAVHCSAGKNGVTVGEAYSAGFRYIRQPSFYPSADGSQSSGSQTGGASTVINPVTVNDSLQDMINSGINHFTSTPEEDFIGPVMNPDFVGPKLSILSDKIVLKDEEIEVFKDE